MSGWVCSWKNAQEMFLAVPWVWLWPLSDSTMSFYVYIRQKDDKQFCDITWSNQETFNFFGRIYGYVRFNNSIFVIGFKNMHEISYYIGYFIHFSLNLSLKLSFLTKPTFPKFVILSVSLIFRQKLLRFTTGFTGFE